MDFDTVMFAMIFAGFGLCAAYFWAVYVRWRNQKAAEIRRSLAFGQLYAARPRPTELKVATGAASNRPQGRDSVDSLHVPMPPLSLRMQRLREAQEILWLHSNQSAARAVDVGYEKKCDGNNERKHQ